MSGTTGTLPFSGNIGTTYNIGGRQVHHLAHMVWPGHCDNGRLDGVPLVVETSIKIDVHVANRNHFAFGQPTHRFIGSISNPLVMVRLAQTRQAAHANHAARETMQVPAVTESSSFAILYRSRTP